MVAVIFIVIGAIIGAGWMLVFGRLGTKGSIGSRRRRNSYTT